MPFVDGYWRPDNETYRVEIPGVPPSANASSGQHWGAIARSRRQFRGAAKLLALAHVQARRGRPLAAARIDILLVRKPRVRPRDPDSVIACAKPCVDGIVDARLILDDGPLYVEYGAIEQRVGPVPLTILTLTEIQPRIV